MYVRETTKTVKGRTYTNHLLVSSIMTPKGPRQRTICSLGDLSPRSQEEWLRFADKVETALSGQGDWLEDNDPEVQAIVARIRRREAGAASRRAKAPPARRRRSRDEDLIRIYTDRVSLEKAREAGPVYVGWEFFKRLGLPEILAEVGLKERSRTLTAAMVLNRLVYPCPENAMPAWFSRTAVEDILGVDLAGITPFPLYRNLDKLYPRRERIEAALVQRERDLFNLDATICLYDLTSTYFEGTAAANPKARRGYSRDSRPDAKQVVVGLVVNRDGFPIIHEIFAGNTVDRSTVDVMLDLLARRADLHPGQTIIVDRGMAYDDNLEAIRRRDMFYIVAARQSERDRHIAEFEDAEGFQDVVRKPSPLNPFQKKSRVQVKALRVGDETHILCLSDERAAKDRAIREKHEERFLADVARLQASVAKGRVAKTADVNQRIGRLKERYPRVARYYRLVYDEAAHAVTCERQEERLRVAQAIDGAYLLRTNRHDLSGEDAWRLYMLLTRAENAFRTIKSPLGERPIHHRNERRVDTHIFLCILAYHLLAAIEKTLLDQGVHDSWATVRDALQTHQICTVVLPAEGGWTLRIRQATKPEKHQEELYRLLSLPTNIISKKRTWTETVAE